MPILPVTASQKSVTQSPSKRGNKMVGAGDVTPVDLARDPGLSVPHVNVVPGAFQSSVGAIANAFGPEVKALSVRVKAHEDAVADQHRKVALARAKLQTEKAYIDIQNGLAEDTDFYTHGERFVKESDKVRETIGSDLDEQTRTDYEMWADQLTMRSEQSVRSAAKSNLIKRDAALLMDNANEYVELIARAKTPEESATRKQEYVSMLQDADGKLLASGASVKLIKDGLRKADLLKADDALQVGFARASSMLQRGELSNLTADDVNRLEDQIKRAQEADAKKQKDDEIKSQKSLQRERAMDAMISITTAVKTNDDSTDIVRGMLQNIIQQHKDDPGFYGDAEFLKILQAAPKITQETRAQRDASLALDTSLLNGSGIPDTASNKKEVDRRYAQEVADGADPVMAAIQYAQIGVIPPAITTKATTAINLGNMDDIQLVADFRAQQVHAAPTQALPNSAFYDDINLLRNHVDLKTAYDIALQQARLGVAEKNKILKSFKDANTGIVKTELENAIGIRAWENTPEVNKNVAARFNELAKFFYVNMPPETRDIKEARNRAAREMADDFEVGINPTGDKPFLYSIENPEYKARLLQMDEFELKNEQAQMKHKQGSVEQKVIAFQEDLLGGKPVTANEAIALHNEIDDLKSKVVHHGDPSFIDFLHEEYKIDEGGLGGLVKWAIREMTESDADKRLARDLSAVNDELKTTTDPARITGLRSTRKDILDSYMTDYIARYADARNALAMPELTFDEIVNAAVQNPNEFVSAMLHSFVQDPEFLLIPGGAIRTAAMGAQAAQKVVHASHVLKQAAWAAKTLPMAGRVVGGAGGAATMGGATNVGVDYLIQMGGNPNESSMEVAAKTGVVVGAIFGAISAPFSAMIKSRGIAGSENVVPEEAILGVAQEIAGGKSVREAANTLAEIMGAQIDDTTLAAVESNVNAILAADDAIKNGADSVLLKNYMGEITEEQFNAIAEQWARDAANPVDLKYESMAGRANAKKEFAVDLGLRKQSILNQMEIDRIFAKEQVSAEIEQAFRSKELDAELARELAFKFKELDDTKITRALDAEDDWIDMISAKDMSRLDDIDVYSFGGKGKFRQSGEIDPKLLTMALAIGTPIAAGAGAGAFLNPEDRRYGAKVGAMIAGTGMMAAAGGKRLLRYASDRGLKAFGKAMQADELFQNQRGSLDVDARHTAIFQKAIRETLPDPSSRERVSRFLDGDTEIVLSPEEMDVALEGRKWFDALYDLAEKEGVIQTHLDDYLPHLWKRGESSPSAFMESLKRGHITSASRHAKQRKIMSIKEGESYGLVPETLDFADIVGAYSHSISRAVRTKELVNHLRQTRFYDIPAIIMPEDRIALSKEFKAADMEFQIPDDYVQVDIPVLRGVAKESYRAVNIDGQEYRVENGLLQIGDSSIPVKGGQQSVVVNGKKAKIIHKEVTTKDVQAHVHPDLVDPLKAAFDNGFDNFFMNFMLPANFLAKRMLVSMSGFHANALMESTIYAGANPAKIPRYAHMLLNGTAGDMVDEALRHGLKLGIVEDVNKDIFYSAFKDIRNAVDRLGPVVGKIAGLPIDAFVGVNKAVDHVMWDTIATGGKLLAYESRKASIAKTARIAGKHMTQAEINRAAAKFTNDAFGGQDWVGLAENLESRIMRRIAYGLTKKSGRQVMQLVMFAPDWTISNVRILGKALPGVTDNPALRASHQAYFIRAALMYAVLWDGVNMMMSGHHIWDNEDPTTVDLGDGRTLQPTKQFTEFFHWFEKPWQSLLNKGGIIPKEIAAQAMNKEWLSVHGAPTMRKSEDGWGQFWEGTAHALSNFIPIGFQQMADAPEGERLERWSAGMLGHPIYGNYED